MVIAKILKEENREGVNTFHVQCGDHRYFLSEGEGITKKGKDLEIDESKFAEPEMKVSSNNRIYYRLARKSAFGAISQASITVCQIKATLMKPAGTPTI